MLTTMFAAYQNRFWHALEIEKLKTDEDDFSGNILPDPKAGGAGGGWKGLLSRNFMKLVVKGTIV
jgi:hypothetical protein